MMPSIDSERTRRDVYVAISVFCIISVIALPVGAFLAYRAWQIHRQLPDESD